MGRSPHNLLLLTVDAWRADFVDAYDGVALSPSLHSLLPRAVRFTRAYANGPWTSPGLMSLFCGENAVRHGVHFEWSARPPGSAALATQLQAAGYHTPNICYLNRVGNYQNLGYAAAAAPDYPKSGDDPQLLRAIAETKEPWFLWYHYKFVHLPYWPGAAYRRLFGIDDDALPERLRDSVCSRFVVPRKEFALLPEDRELLRRLYAGGVRQMDDFIGRVSAALSARRLDERTTWVVTADHGDELLEHGHVGHASTAHHATLYEEVLRIPLVIVDPRVAATRNIETRVQQLDLYSTLLSLCGLTPPPISPSPLAAVDLSPLITDGKQPMALSPERPFLFMSSRMGYLTPREHASQSIWAASDGRRKLIREEYDAPRSLLFDLRRDPDEQQPITDGAELREAEAWARRLYRAALEDPA
jgi:choline-sulfatase